MKKKKSNKQEETESAVIGTLYEMLPDVRRCRCSIFNLN